MLAALLWPAGGQAAETLPGPVTGEVVKVVDGDTLDVRIRIWLGQELETKVRLHGIDTPESRSRCTAEKDLAKRAQRRLQALVTGAKSTVLLHDVTNDKFGGRVRARVLLPDGTDLAAALVVEGFARPYDGGTRQPWCPGPAAVLADGEPTQVGEAGRAGRAGRPPQR